MERQRDKAKEISKELRDKTEKELTDLRKELLRLRELKKQRQLEQVESNKGVNASEITQKEEELEKRLDSIDSYLGEQLDNINKEIEQPSMDTQQSNIIESELKSLEQEIIGEKGVIEKELSPYELMLEDYPWLEEVRYEYMFDMSVVQDSPGDFESWKKEGAKVLFDYAKYAILHILYIRKLITQKPFSKFTSREKAIKEIAEELIEQNLARWINKKKKSQLRVFWKTLDVWAEDIYDWAYEIGKMEPIMMFEIREAKQDFSSLPKEDLEEIFRILEKEDRATLLKLDDGKVALQIKPE